MIRHRAPAVGYSPGRRAFSNVVVARIVTGACPAVSSYMERIYGFYL
jgi:hypothetical protein